LFQILEPEKFKTFSEKRKEKNTHAGISVMLAGPSGTGKTELVMQLAKTTGREVFLFQVSEQKDMYHGESEKRLKEVFAYYAERAKDPLTAPILCFNEADSIFSMRRNGSHNLQQLENTIQTLLLNEMEKLNGILICTTNVPEHFDAAFQRRFLYRIHIAAPDVHTRCKLLRAYFPGMAGAQARALSELFPFTAAHLNNFRDKQEIEKIISQKRLSLIQSLSDFLSEETQKFRIHNKNVIGFRVGEKQNTGEK
jgi:SpoVK/Ycf46/Vps4 family AAA+-type ATPase